MQYLLLLVLSMTASLIHAQSADDNMLGLPPVPIPADNPQTPAKIQLGDKLFHDKRFSIDGTVSCANCHNDNLAFTDGLQFSVGHHGLVGTRNAPTVLNAANEIAVDAFLNERVRFTDIPVIIERCMKQFDVKPADSLEIILDVDKEARKLSNQIIDELIG